MKNRSKVGIIIGVLSIILMGCNNSDKTQELLGGIQHIGKAEIYFQDTSGVSWNESIEFDEDTIHCVSDTIEYYAQDSINYVNVGERVWEKYETGVRNIKDFNLSNYGFSPDKKSTWNVVYGTVPVSDVIDGYSGEFVTQLTFNKLNSSLEQILFQSEEIRLVIDISNGDKFGIPDYILAMTEKDFVQIIYSADAGVVEEYTEEEYEIPELVFDDEIFSQDLPLVMIIFDKDVVEPIEVSDWSGLEERSEENYVLTDIINYYYPEELVSYISIWGSLDNSMKKALVSFINKGIISEDTFVMNGVDGTEIEKILKEINK